MCVTSNFQIKALPKYWNVFWHVLQAGSLGCRLGWRLVLGCVSEVPLGSSLWNQEGRNRIEQRERSSCITGQMTWADPMESWSEDSTSGLSWHVQWPGWDLHLHGTLHRSYPQKTWWLKAFPATGERVLEGRSGQPISILHNSMCHSSKHGWLGCAVGETLDDWQGSQNDDLLILLSALWSKKSRRSM